jgi:hypothetical protein
MSSTNMVQRLFADYARNAPDDRPLAAYGGLIGLFNATLVGFLLAARRAGRPLPEHVGFGDIVLLGVATHKLSRLLAKDTVTSALRAPFTEFEQPAGDGELKEKPRGSGWQHALGELLTCPFCLGQWVAAFFAYGLALAPRSTRLVGSIFAIVAVSDFLHLAYGAVKQQAEQPPD